MLHIRRPSNKDTLQGVAFVVIFAAVVVGFFIYVSRAATVATSFFEAETATRTGPVTEISDSTASAGKAIKFGPADNGGTATPPPSIPGNWKAIFADEFNGTQLDSSKWQLCNPSFTGQGGYAPNTCKTTFNDEQELFRTTYTNNPNVQVKDGTLRLIATKEGNQIYSGMISTGPDRFGYNPPNYQKFNYTYGYFEARARFPRGQGFWPSFWMLPDQSNVAPDYNCKIYPRACDGWPTSGEYDLVEVLGGSTNQIHMTEHDQNTGGVGDGVTVTGTDAADGMHTYGIDWEPGYIKWYLDGQLRKTYTNGVGIKNYPFYIIANFSVGGGGSWGGAWNGGTPFPSTYEIDYMRVYKSQ